MDHHQKGQDHTHEQQDHTQAEEEAGRVHQIDHAPLLVFGAPINAGDS